MAKTRKVNPKDALKSNVSSIVAEALIAEGFEVVDGKEVYGMTAHTLVAQGNEFDIQIKFIAPKTNVSRYTPLAEEVEEVEDE